MLKRRRKLSKDLQIRKKLLPLHKISGISAKQSSELVVLLSICIFFAEDKRHLGIIAQASLASPALDLHFLCKRKAALAQSPSSGAVQSSRQLNTLVN